MTNWKLRSIKMLLESEGMIPHMYCDTKGFVTIGTGFLLSSPEAVKDLPMYYPGTLDLASLRDKEVEWEKVKDKFKPNMVARYYKEETSLIISDTTNTSLLEKKINTFKDGLVRNFGMVFWYEAPENIKVALIDMAYNLGVNGILTKFPTFTNHLWNRNWEGCAEECSRKDVSDERNEEIKQLFLSCVK